MKNQNLSATLPLVYVINNKVVSKPDFDAANKDNLVGILIGKIIVALKEQVVSWSQAHWIAYGKKLCSCEAFVPDRVIIRKIRRNLESFNATVRLLQQNGIAADTLNSTGIYWLDEEFSHGKAIAFLMKDQLPTLLDKFDEKSGILRIVWKLN